jgi:hypothetical protein
VSGIGSRGCLAQVCRTNSLLRSSSKSCFISSNVSPLGGPVGLKIHAHCEHPQPRKRGWSIHTNSRGMAQLYVFCSLLDCFLTDEQSGTDQSFQACSSKTIMSPNINTRWMETYLRAALEVDGQKMPQRIISAREAVAGRLKSLEGNSDHHAERHDMESALAALAILEDEARTWPTVGESRALKDDLDA